MIGRLWRVGSGAKLKDEVVVGVTQRLANDQQLRVAIRTPLAKTSVLPLKRGRSRAENGSEGIEVCWHCFRSNSLRWRFCVSTPTAARQRLVNLPVNGMMNIVRLWKSIGPTDKSTQRTIAKAHELPLEVRCTTHGRAKAQGTLGQP